MTTLDAQIIEYLNVLISLAYFAYFVYLMNMNQLMPINIDTTLENIKPLLDSKIDTYLIFLPHRFTKQEEIDQVHKLIDQLELPKDYYIEINISSIVQKTWRIIHHYQPSLKDQGVTTTELSQINRSRIDQLQHHITEMIITDQALRLNAKVVKP